MKNIWLGVCLGSFGALSSLEAQILMREAALPYHFQPAPVRAFPVPECTDEQYIGVSGTQLVCKGFSACLTGEYVATISGTTPVCKVF
jgi:hypothetical protein